MTTYENLPTLTAAELRFEASLDAEYDQDRWYEDNAQDGFGTCDEFGCDWNGCDTCEDDSDGFTDAEADADALASAGYGTDEDYGYFGDSEFFGEG